MILKPFTAEELQESIDTFAKSGMEGVSQVMTFYSPKGKSGKTTLIANLALALARKTEEQVGIIDADLQFGDLTLFFNLHPQATIVEAVHDIDDIAPVTLNNRYFTPVAKNVHVLCGTRSPNLIDRVSIRRFEDLVRMSRSLYRYLLIDVPPGFNPTSIAAAELADTTYVVSMVNGGYEVEHMRRALDIFRDWDDYESSVRPIFTRVTTCDASSLSHLEHDLGNSVDAIIPNAYQIVSAAADNGNMAMDIEPDSELAISVNRLAKNIIGRHRIRWNRS